MTNKQQNILFSIVRTMIAILISLMLVLVIIFAISKEPLKAIATLLTGPLTSVRRMGNVVETATPLIFTGLSACVMFQARQFSMIGDGAFFLGALLSTTFVINVSMADGIHPISAILIGGVTGGLCGILPGLLKAKWDANEFVVSMMFNYVLVYGGLFILYNYIRDSKSGFLASFLLPESSRLTRFVCGTRIHSGIIIALVMVVLTYLFIYRTKFGYAIRMTGINRNFAEYSGISTFMVIMMCQVVGGFIAGIGGATEILGMYERFQWQDTPGYGFDGLTVAILAANNPALVPIGAFFLAYLRVGTDIVARISDVPNEAVSIIQGVVILLVTASAFLANWKHKMVVHSAKALELPKEVK